MIIILIFKQSAKTCEYFSLHCKGRVVQVSHEYKYLDQMELKVMQGQNRSSRHV